MNKLFVRLQVEVNDRLDTALEARRSEEGFTTAELLGNAALGVVALAAIWTLFMKEGGLGEKVVNFIGSKMSLNS